MRMLMGENEPYVDGKAQRRPSQGLIRFIEKISLKYRSILL